MWARIATSWCQWSDTHMIAPWAKEELVTADLNDLRLNERLELLLSALGERPLP